jgi:hypothetical protein
MKQQEVLSLLYNGFPLHVDDTWRGIEMMTGIISTPELPVVETNNKVILDAIYASGGFGFAVSRTIKPGFMAFQRGIEGVTRSYWGHSKMIIGDDIGMEARKRNPDIVEAEVLLGKVPKIPSRLEVVESQALVAVTDLSDVMGNSEQMIVFVNPTWTREQKVQMALEAYSYVGRPYDIAEIAKWVLPGIPNPTFLKVCSSLVNQIIYAGDPTIDDWCRDHGLNPQQVAPRDTFAFGSDKKFATYSFRCSYADALVPAE